MEPIAFQLGKLTIRWYGLMAACGFIAAILLMEFNRKFAKLTKDQSSTLLLQSLVLGIIGARIFYCVQFHRYYADDWFKVFRIDQGGLVFYGGFILAFIGVVIYTLKNKLDTVRVLDVFAPAMAAAHGFGRIGCFLNGCCFGRDTNAWWGIRPPVGSLLEYKAGSDPLHPVQLLEAGENFLLCALYCYLLRKYPKRGLVMSLYLLIYGVLRFFNEMLRGDNELYFHLTPAQWIGILLTVGGTASLVYFLRKKDVEAA